MSEKRGLRALGRHALSGFVVLLLLALPTARAQETSQKSPSRGFLGVLVGPAENDERSVTVREVTPGSPAATAGLKRGDRIMKIADEDVKDSKAFTQNIGAKKPGDKVTLRVLRDNKEQTVTVTLGERPTDQQIAPAQGTDDGRRVRRPAFLGVQTQPLSPDAKKRLDTKADAGALITEVVPNSPAAKAGLKVDDVIMKVNDQPVGDSTQLRDAVQRAGPGKEVALQVARGKEDLTIKATLREGAFGQLLTPGDDRFPLLDPESARRRIRELERRIEELEKRLREFEKK